MSTRHKSCKTLLLSVIIAVIIAGCSTETVTPEPTQPTGETALPPESEREDAGLGPLDPQDIESVLEWTTYAVLSGDASPIADLIPSTGVPYEYSAGPQWVSESYTLEAIGGLLNDLACLGVLDDKSILFAEQGGEQAQHLFQFHQTDGGWELEAIYRGAGPSAYPVEGHPPCPGVYP